MARLALIDDDPVESLLIEGLLEHAGGRHQVQAFASVEAFSADGGPDYDLVLLDRRLPPHQSFESSLSVLSECAYRGPVVLVTAGPCEENNLRWPGALYGPLDKADLLTPDALARLINDMAA